MPDVQSGLSDLSSIILIISGHILVIISMYTPS